MKRKAEALMMDKVARRNRIGEEVAHYKYRVAMCQRGIDGEAAVAIRASPDKLHARFHGLQTCGSVWHCPMCAPRIALERGEEAGRAIKSHWVSGGETYFATYTMQHEAGRFGFGQLQSQLHSFQKALAALKGSRAFRAVMDQAREIGTIRALEVTYGEINGWHTHTHELIFAGAHQMKLLRTVRCLWARQLLKRGLAGLRPGEYGSEVFRRLRALYRHCFTVQAGEAAAKYAAGFGWGVIEEMTMSHLKRGRGGVDDRGGFVPQRCRHATPWGLLNDECEGDRRSGDLWREYAVAFHGRRQLRWSNGLRAHFGLIELTDEEIAAAPETQCSEHVMEISPGQWRQILRYEARAEVLRIAAASGRDAVLKFIQELAAGPPPQHVGTFTHTVYPFRRAS